MKMIASASRRCAEGGAAKDRAARVVMAAIMLSVCGMAAAIAGPAELGAAADLSGRWSGQSFRCVKTTASGGNGCQITLDISRCGEAWCGLRVTDADGKRCGGEAMRLEANPEAKGPVFQGRLTLAEGSEPYVIEARLRQAAGEAAVTLDIIGDTGPELRYFRRSFPFEAMLTRSGDAVCKKDDKPVS